MSFRELLRYEIWSEETTRKMLAMFWRTSKRLLIVLGVLLGVIGVIAAVEYSLLTNGERKSGKAALANLEELENLVECNCDKFAVLDVQARATTRIAAAKAFTVRDNDVAGILYLYLTELEDDHQQFLLIENMKATNLKWHPNSEWIFEEKAMDRRSYEEDRTILHRNLD